MRVSAKFTYRSINTFKIDLANGQIPCVDSDLDLGKNRVGFL